MPLNLLDQARAHIREELRSIDGFIDAENVAAIIHKTCPTVDFQSLVNTVIEEALALGGSVSWAGSGLGKLVTSNRMVRYAAIS